MLPSNIKARVRNIYVKIILKVILKVILRVSLKDVLLVNLSLRGSWVDAELVG